MTETAVNETGATDDEAGTVFRLIWELLVQRFTIMVRYRVNFLAQLVGAYMFFAVIFFGGQMAVDTTSASASAMDSTFDGFLVGWFLYMIVQSAYFSLPGDVTKESEWGTLEQLYMTPYGFGTLMSAKVLVDIVQSVVLGGAMLALMLVTTQRTFTIDVFTIVPILLLGVLSVVGIGFVFAGLALIYKRIESFFQFVQFALIGLIAAPVANIPALRLLPLVQGSAMLQDAMRGSIRLWEFSAVDLGILAGTAVAYSVAGYAVFLYCSRIARKRGVMGHY